MNFTTYGRQLAEPAPQAVTSHAEACGHDSSIRVVMTGHDSDGRAFRCEARSVYGAFMTMRACWGLERAWHYRPDGTRRLLMSR